MWKVEAQSPLLKSKKGQTLARINTQNGTGIKASQNKNGLSDSLDVSYILLNRYWARTSCTDVLAAPSTRNAKNPGTKLIAIAASGVCPLFVRPAVFLIKLNELLRARKKSVRLET